MALNSFDRNYGASLNSREFFHGNAGFFTVVIDMPGTAELGETAVSVAETDAYATAKSAAEYNQFKIAQLIGQRAVITACSSIDLTTGAVSFSGGNALNFDVNGTSASGDSAVTFLIERADVFNAQSGRPGAGNPTAYAVNPLEEMSAVLTSAGFFKNADGTDAVATVDVTLAVMDAFSPIIAA